jgi:ribosome recycling factor
MRDLGMLDDLQKDGQERMKKCVLALREEFSKVRTGRAQPGLVENLMVDSYDQKMPLRQLATIVVSDARTLLITPWDKNLVQPIDKALRASDLGLNPVLSGQVIRIPLPPLNEERRKELVRVVRHEAEQARISIRNVRRDVLSKAKQLHKEKALTEDEMRKAEDLLQKLTDSNTHEIDHELSRKEAELLEV